MSRGTRIGIALLGAVVSFVGLGMWSFETDYNTLGLITTDVNGEVQVWEHEVGWDQTNIRVDDPEAKTPEALEAAGGELVFIGNALEADRYMTDRHQESNNYLVEGLVIGVGALLILFALFPRKKVEQAVEDTQAVDDSLVSA